MAAMPWRTRICGAVVLLVVSTTPITATTAHAATGKVIAGWLENVYVTAAADRQIVAKLDSGARTSSIYARNIESFTRNDEPWVRFELVLGGKKEGAHLVPLERPVVRYVRIKEHDGNHNRRPIVDLEFCFSGRLHRTEFSLVDRSQFNYSVLLGRRFLAGIAVIDPDASFLTKPDCISSVTRVSQP